MPAGHSRKTAIRQFMAARMVSYAYAARSVDDARQLALTEPRVCPGPESCEDLDCCNGCHDAFVSLCGDCGHLFGGYPFPDSADGSCPNGCR
jgi:hypothetical protein